MRKYVFLITILTIIFMLLIGTYYSCLASDKYDITGDRFKNEWNIKNDQGNQEIYIKTGSEPFMNLITFIINKVLGIIQIFAGLLMVLCIAFTGFNMLLTSNHVLASEIGLHAKNVPVLKRLQDFNRHLLTGTVLVFFSTTIVRIAFDVLTDF